MKHLLITISIILCAVIVYGKGSSEKAGNSSPTIAALSKHAPLSFIENKGQVMDQCRKPRTDIQFRVAAAPGLNIFIGNGAIYYQFSKCDGANGKFQESKIKKSKFPAVAEAMTSDADSNLGHTSLSLGEASFSMYRMDVELIGANKNAQIITEEKQDYYENYFNENTNRRTVTAQTYNRITYKNIYPHIDWILYISNGQLKHEFVVNEGGNAADIQLKYGGATSIKLNTDGSLAAATPQGVITEQAPSAYQQDGQAVKSNFKITGDLVTYEIGSYSGRLVIDPALEWATYFGGSGGDGSNSVATDKVGNVYIAGQTNSTSDIATSGTYQVAYQGGSSDAFLAKFDSTCVIQWATYFGGAGDDAGLGVAIDGSENVFITGLTNSTTGIATFGAYQTIEADSGLQLDVFIAKLNSTGAILWATYYGGNGTDEVLNLATDEDEDVYITGKTTSTSGISTISAYQAIEADGGLYGDAFLAKFNSVGTIQWATYYGGSRVDDGKGIATDGLGNVYITGETRSPMGIATIGAYDTILGGSLYNAYLVKFNSIGEIQWATYYGINGEDIGEGVATDGSGNIFITGYTSSTTGMATSGGYQPGYGGGPTDAFLAKFNSAGVIQWATYYGGDGQDGGERVITDGSGNVYMTGWTNSGGVTTPDASQPIFGGGTFDCYLAEFNNAGAIQWATYYGGNGSEIGAGLTGDGFGNVYITGQTSSTSGIATPGSYQTVEADGGTSNDAFLAKFNICNSSNTCTEGVPTLSKQHDISIYPNPAQNEITVSSSSPITGIAIANLLGQVVRSQTSNSEQVQVDVSGLPPGVYFVRINGMGVRKFVKE